MADVITKLVTQNGDTVVLKEESIPAATPLTKGGVKQGDSALCYWRQNNKDLEIEDSYNDLIRSLRSSGIIQNDKFALIFDLNGENADFDKYGDLQEMKGYSAGQNVTLDFSDPYNVPEQTGYTFLGYALTPNATGASIDYPYDENDPQSYTITFTNSDIILYAIWGETVYTLTYSLGDYGTGSVPSSQTVAEGGEVQVADDPTPTVNDGSGRVFVGWSTNDGGFSMQDVAYPVHSMIYLYSDTTLYPVFAAQVTLTYALGNDATGTVPSAETVYYGEYLAINFNPSVTCISDNTKVFAGWSTTDESSYADYTSSGTNEIYMSSDVTLYPVFEAQGGGGGDTDTITVDATNSVDDIYIGHYDSEMDYFVNDKVITAGTSDTFTFNTSIDEYTISFNSAGSASIRAASFTGSYDNVGYNDDALTIGDDYDAYVIITPDGNGHTWFASYGISGTLTCISSQGS